MNPFYNRWWWRLSIDGVVLLGGLFLLLYFVPGADDWVYPDDSIVLDEAMATFVTEIPPTQFATDTPLPLNSVTGVQLAEAIPSSPSSSTSEILHSVRASTVYLYADSVDGAWHGAGVVLTADGLIATNAHVVEGAKTLAVARYGDKTLYPVTEVVYVDMERDMAVVQVEVGDARLTPLPLRTTEAGLGETVYAIGHPEDFLYSVSAGVVSGMRTFSGDGSGTNLQVTTPISAGSSGGPLVDASGALLGIMTWSLEYAENAVSVQNLNFAIPTSAFLELFILPTTGTDSVE